MRATKAVFNFADFGTNESQIRDEKPKKKAKASKGLSFVFNAKEQLQKDEESTPINILNRSTSPLQKISKPHSEIKTVMSHIIVAEEPKSDIPPVASDTIITNNSIKSQPKKSLFKEEPKQSIQINKQEQFVEDLFIELLNKGQSNYSSVIEHLQNSPPQKEKIVSFFIFRQIWMKIAQKIKISSVEQMNHAIQQLEKLICQKITIQLKQGNKNLNSNTFPEIFMPILTNTLENYIDQLLTQDQTQKALTIANLSDKTFLNFPSKYATKHFKSQLNCLRQKNLQLLKKSSWILQLGLVIKIFKSENIYEYGGQIIQRQIKFLNHVLPSEFLLFCLEWTQLSKLRRFQKFSSFKIEQDGIVKLLKSMKGVSLRELWQFFIILRAYRPNYQQAYKMVLQKLIKKLKKPKNFVALISMAQIKLQQITLFFNIYINENFSIKENPQYVEDLKRQILQGLSVEQTKKEALKLTEWVNLCQLENLYKKRNLEQYLVRFVENYQKLQRSDFVNFENLLKNMRQIITDFRICCNYKLHKRVQTYKLLCQLERNLNSKKGQYLDIVLGCKSFLELKQGIFCLNEKQKLKNIEYLFQYLNKEYEQLNKINNQTKKQQVTKVLRSIEDTLLQMLQTNSGQIYLSELCNQMNKQKESLFQSDGINVLLQQKGNSFSILMKILRQNQNILNKMVLLLGFR